MGKPFEGVSEEMDNRVALRESREARTPVSSAVWAWEEEEVEEPSGFVREMLL